ncbi:MAG: aspartate aminotransferase family protein [Paenibacillaceae bacterium]|nr:aspartate aminotransferase family protein [Paenibacillaceae bacterium]
MGERDALFPNYAPFPMRLVRGEGSRVWDEHGRSYIDLMSGVAVTSLGHAPRRVVEALEQQLRTLWHVSNWYDIPQQQQYARMVTEQCCADVAFFCNSGAEANEAAIKLARRTMHTVRKEPHRTRIVTFLQSFHGRTMATLSATGQDKVKYGFAPLVPDFVHIPYNDCAALHDVVDEHTCAIMVECVQGEGGVRVATQAFADAIRELCARYDVLLIADEIQSGFGRTGKLFAYEHVHLEPDIITTAKGIASGFPMGMMMAKRSLAQAFSPGTHGSTFGGNPLACAAAIATWRVIMEEQLIDRARTIGEAGMAYVRDALAHCDGVREVRGRGMMIGIELIDEAVPVIQKLIDRGVLAINAGPNVLRLLPAFTIEEELWFEGLAHVVACIEEVHAMRSKTNQDSVS